MIKGANTYPPHNSADGMQKSGGIARMGNKHKLGNLYSATEKFLIIGKGGSGKTTLAFDLALSTPPVRPRAAESRDHAPFIESYSSIVYICSHFEDNIVVNFEEWCKEAGMPFYEISVGADGSLNVPEIKRGLFIIDDYYTSTNRPKSLESLLKILVNKGRHSGNHVIYIAHTPKFLPIEILNNNTGVFVDRPYEKFPVSKEIPPTSSKKQWYLITDDATSEDACIRSVSFDTFETERSIIKTLRAKIPKEDRGKMMPDAKDYINMSKQGNIYAGKAGKAMKGGASAYGSSAMTAKVSDDTDNLPMFGNIDSYYCGGRSRAMGSSSSTTAPLLHGYNIGCITGN